MKASYWWNIRYFARVPREIGAVAEPEGYFGYRKVVLPVNYFSMQVKMVCN
jgi:hypothetical protein